MWQHVVSLAAAEPSEQNKKTLRRLVLAFGLPVVAIAVLHLLTGIVD